MINELSRIVKEVGLLVLMWRKTLMGQGQWIGDQFKAKIDNLAHQALVDRLTSLDSQIPIISEEDPDSQVLERPSCYWLIDPIDGTASFAHGYPGFVTQAVLMVNNQPELAAIYAPVSNTLYVATRGGSSYRNGELLTIEQKKNVSTLIDNYPEPRGIARAARDHFQIKHYIECGSISLKICKIADGTADLFLKDTIVRDWDLAAPHLVLESAGGCLLHLDGTPFYYTGNYRHTGLVASFSKEKCMAVASWLTKEKSERGHYN